MILLPLFYSLIYSPHLSVVWGANSELSTLRKPCDNNNNNNHRIVGGQVTDIKHLPYQVSLLFNDEFFCGGSIVSEEHVVTAAHCLLFFIEELSREGRLYIRAGSNYTEKGGILTRVKRTLCHPKFDFDDYDYDVCILKLRNRLIFSETVQPVKIADEEPKGGEVGFVAGWGTLGENGESPKELYSVFVALTNKTYCYDAYKSVSPITERMICAGTEGKDSCQGDSGGGLVVEETLVGVSSTGFGCGVKNYPGVYTSIAHPDIRRFIKEVTNV